jgi:hypothetical protein
MLISDALQEKANAPYQPGQAASTFIVPFDIHGSGACPGPAICH